MSPRWLVSLLLAGSCSLLAGCAILGGGEEHVGGHATLGDAARAANPDSTGKQRRLDVGDTVPKETEVEVDIAPANPATPPPADHEPTTDEWSRLAHGRWVVGLLAGGGAIAGHRYDGFGDLGLEVGRARDRLQAVVVLSASPTEFASQTIAGRSFENEIELNLELNARYVLTPTHAFMGVYGIAGTRFSTLFWDYARPVPVEEDGVKKDVTDDSINHWSLFAGGGISFLQTRHLHAGFQGLAGVRFYSWTTQAGFSNTLFPPAGFVLVRFELAPRF